MQKDMKISVPHEKPQHKSYFPPPCKPPPGVWGTASKRRVRQSEIPKLSERSDKNKKAEKREKHMKLKIGNGIIFAQTHDGVHELKILPEYFEAVVSGKKTFEIRHDDRNFKAGDRVVLREWDNEKKEYTGNAVCILITYVIRDVYGLCDRHCAFSFKPETIYCDGNVTFVEYHYE